MTLRLVGEKMGIDERIETIAYIPGLQDTGDLEVGTKTITATSKQATADYSASLTLPNPSDARLAVLRICARLQVTRNSGTSTNLYCTVSIDSADGSGNRVFNGVDVQAASLQATDLSSGGMFDLLSDGNAHTFYFFFWVDSGDSVISLVELWEAVGSKDTQRNMLCLSLTFKGMVSAEGRVTRQGTGVSSLYFSATEVNNPGWRYIYNVTASPGEIQIPSAVVSNPRIAVVGTVVTDLNHISDLVLVLRSLT